MSTESSDSSISDYSTSLDDDDGWQPEKSPANPSPSQISVAPTAADFPSLCTFYTAKAYACTYNVPSDHDLRAPTPEERAHAPPPGYTAIYTYHFRHGLRLPLPEFVVTVLAFYKIALAQFHPNAIFNLVKFIDKCEGFSIVPTIGLFRHFYEVRGIKKGSEGWYTFRARPANKIEFGQAKIKGWKSWFLFFKSGTLGEKFVTWNHSPIVDPPLTDDERPSAEEINILMDGIRVLSRRKFAESEDSPDATEMQTKRLKRSMAKSPATELTRAPLSMPSSGEDMTTDEEQFVLDIQKSVTSFILHLKEEKEKLKKVIAAKEQEGKDKDIEIASLQKDKEHLQKLLLEKDKKMAFLEEEVDEREKFQKVLITAMETETAALKSKLDTVVADRGPLLKVYTSKLLKSKGFGKFFSDLTISAQKLGCHKAAKKLRRRFPAIPKEALVELEDPQAGSRLDKLFYCMIQDGAFKFPLLEHLLSLREIPSSSELKQLKEDVDEGARIPPPPVTVFKIERGLQVD